MGASFASDRSTSFSSVLELPYVVLFFACVQAAKSMSPKEFGDVVTAKVFCDAFRRASPRFLSRYLACLLLFDIMPFSVPS